MKAQPEDFFQHKRVLVTGASGFIGRHLVRRLQDSGAAVAAISRNQSGLPGGIRHYATDIRDLPAMNNCLAEFQPEYIFHLAAFKERSDSIPAFYNAIETNLVGSLNLFSAAKDVHTVRSIVALGTIEEYGNNRPPFDERYRESPVTPYSFSKICVSHLGGMFYQLYGLPVVIIRSALVYGPGQGTEMFLPALINTLLDDKPFTMTPGEQTRDFVYVADLVEGLILAAKTTRAQGRIINIGSGVPTKIKDLTHIVETMTGKTGLANPGGKPYGKNEVMEYYLDVRQAEDILGWKAKTPIEDGLIRTIAYYRGVKGL
jgi:nucleoside-diphosphate-sugar epimerase